MSDQFFYFPSRSLESKATKLFHFRKGKKSGILDSMRVVQVCHQQTRCSQMLVFTLPRLLTMDQTA